jgi:ribosome biogenesis GTPase A
MVNVSLIAQNANGDAVSMVSGVSRASSRLQREYIMIGFVGYPNVGKSSTINALLGRKQVGVTSTPGKTKHFQTLIVSDSVMLCDCPGLVFPSVVSSRAEMVSLATPAKCLVWSKAQGSCHYFLPGYM